MRQHEGGMNAYGAEVRLWYGDTRKLAKGSPLLKQFGRFEKAEARDFLTDVAERASGGRERALAKHPELQGYFDALSEQLAKIEARDAAHSAEMGRELALIPDYFPDLFADTTPFLDRVKRVVRSGGRPGVKQFFEKQRTYRTTREALDAGKKFVTYDPAMLIAIRDIAGMRRIQGDILFQKAKASNLAVLDVRGTVPPGWRQPQGIPAFNPKPVPHSAGEGAPLMTPGYAVPEEFARRLEDYFAVGGRSNNPFLNASAWLAGETKKLKVMGSFFQHMDFIKRGAASKLFVGGKPLQIPGVVLDSLEATVLPRKRTQLLREWTTDPFLKQVAKEGAGIIGGQSIAQREMASLIENIKQFPFLGAIPENVPVAGKVAKLLNQASEFVNSGLFDGVYLAQAKHMALDWRDALKRAHPDWTEQRIAAGVADNISLVLSSQGKWQSVFRNPGTRQFMRTLLFSFAESEGLIRGFLRILPAVEVRGVRIGPQQEARDLWRRYWVGYYLMTFAAAEGINYAATGEWLGPEQLNPVRLDESGKPTYNWKFLRPIMSVLPEGTPVYLDLLGQLDTPLRWAIDPFKALKNRLSVPARQALDQTLNRQYTGAPIARGGDPYVERLGQRALYAVREVGVPILPGQIASDRSLPLPIQGLQGLGFGVVAPENERLALPPRQRGVPQAAPSGDLERFSPTRLGVR